MGRIAHMEATLPKLLQRIVRDNPNYNAQLSKDPSGEFQPTTYETLYKEVQSFAAGLMSLGVKRGDHVGLISDNRKEWFITDLALLSLGAADVPRGCDSTAGELTYILSFADCRLALIENEAQMKKVLANRDKLPLLKSLILFDGDFDRAPHGSDLKGIEFHTYGEIMETGIKAFEKDPGAVEKEIAQGKGEDVATVIFTSGTTGEPKGVMLSHKNFLHQVSHVPELINVGPGDIWLCILPVWHSFERIMQYVALGTASTLAYSKPIGKIMLADCLKVRPTWMASVPRIWEAVRAGVYRSVNAEGGAKKAIFMFFISVGSLHVKFKNMVTGLVPQFTKRSRVLDIAVAILPFLLLTPLKALGKVLVYKKIQGKLGGRFTAGISGGGALPESVDKFFQAVGILILEGYGLTETAPVLGVRNQSWPVPGTIGRAFPGTEIKIVDLETKKELDPGEKGLIIARGPQVMLGYLKKPEETQKILNGEGWLDTGDLGMKTWTGEIKITGRAKDTIVLLGGENVEPVPIEARIRESEFIDHAVVLGQDQKFLAALIVPNFELLEKHAKDNSIPFTDMEHLLTLPEIKSVVENEIVSRINPKMGFKGFEMIFRFKLLTKTFELGKELSGKQDYKRHLINEIYAKEIKSLFAAGE
jgi:long-chain acyl-CoA synthetase